MRGFIVFYGVKTSILISGWKSLDLWGNYGDLVSYHVCSELVRFSVWQFFIVVEKVLLGT